MAETEQPLIIMPDADATVSLGDVKHQGGQGLVSRAKWKALADVGQGGVRGLIREVGIRGDAADGTIHNKTGRTIRRDHYAQFAHGSVAIAAPELLVPAGDRTDPPLTEFSRQQVVNQVCVIKCGLPGGVAMLQRNDGRVRRIRRKENLAWRDRRADAKGDALMQQAEEIHIGITANDGKTMPQVKAERLTRIHGQELFPDVIRLDVKKSTQVSLIDHSRVILHAQSFYTRNVVYFFTTKMWCKKNTLLSVNFVV